MSQSLLKSSGYAGISNLIELVLALLTAGLSIRFLGLEDAGFFLFFESLMQVNGGLFNLGFQSAVTKHAGQAIAEGEEGQARRFFEVGMSYDLLVVFLPCLIILGIAPLVVEWSGYSGNTTTALTYIYLSCGTLLFSKLQQVFSTGLMIRHSYGLISSFRIVSNILTNALRIGILLWIPSLPALGWTNAGVMLVGSCILGCLCIRKNHFAPRLRFARKELSQLWNFSKWEYIWSLCSMLTSNMDRILIVKYFGLGVLPIYSMAKRVLTLGHRFIAGFTDYLFPILSGQSQANRATMIQRMDYSLRWSLYGAAALVYGSAIILGPTFLDLVVGDQFGSQVQPYLIAFSAVGFIFLLDILPYHAARANGQTYINTISMLCTTAIVFSSIWFFAKQDDLLMVVICQGFHLPILILHNRWALGYDSLKQSVSRVCLPGVGFILTTFTATCTLIFLESRIPLVIIAIPLSETLLMVGILAVIIHQYRSGKNQQIRDLFQSLLSRGFAIARLYLTKNT
jgi:O-antigen/teichoic acid export membrane protein